MPKREVLQRITIGRGTKTITENGKKVEVVAERIVLLPGQIFDFTDAELAEITKANPNAVTSKISVDLDSPDSLLKVDQTLAGNQSAAPEAKGGANEDDAM